MWKLWHKLFGWDYAIVYMSFDFKIGRVVTGPNGQKIFCYDVMTKYPIDSKTGNIIKELRYVACRDETRVKLQELFPLTYTKTNEKGE